MDRRATILTIYLLVVADAELVMTYHSVTLGLWIYAVLLLFLVGYSTLPQLHKGRLERYFKERNTIRSLIAPSSDAIDYSPKTRREDNFSDLLKCLTLAPLIRILSTSMPVAPLEQIYWFMVINIPLFIIAFLLIRSQLLTKRHLGLRLGNLKIQFLIAMTGFFLGVMDYSLLKPSPMIAYPTPGAFLIPAAILMIFTGFSEELVFRGLIQTHTEKLTGNFYGLVFTSILFAIMHIGWKSPPDLLFVFGVGIFYGYIFQRTKSLMGITISHGITNITMFLVAPFML